MRIIDKFREIRNWFRWNFNIYHFRVVWEAMFNWPFDEYYLLRLTKFRYLEMAHYFEKFGIAEGNKRDAERLKLLAKLIDIINEDHIQLYDYVGNENELIDDGKGKKMLKFNREYKCLVNVNMKNMQRFIEHDYDEKIFKSSPHELYKIKAEKLYFKILQEHLHEFWD